MRNHTLVHPPIAKMATAVAVAVTLSLAPAAFADRAPTSTERSRIARASSAPARCLVIRVSTVDRRFASSTFKVNSGASCQRYGSNGIGIFKRSAKRYRYINGMSDCTPRTFRGVPVKVYRDLTRDYCSN